MPDEKAFGAGLMCATAFCALVACLVVPGCVEDAKRGVYREAADRGFGEFVSEDGSKVEFRWKDGK